MIKREFYKELEQGFDYCPKYHMIIILRYFNAKVGRKNIFKTKILHVNLHQDINPLNPELNPICNLLALLSHHFLHVSRIRVKSLTLRLLMSYIWSTYS